MRRGEIWWANLRDPEGASPGYRRPVVIVQSDSFNRSRIGTVIVVALTSNLKLARAPGNVVLPSEHTLLPRESVANVSQVLTVDRSFLLQRVALLPVRLVHRIEEGLRLVLSL